MADVRRIFDREAADLPDGWRKGMGDDGTGHARIVLRVPEEAIDDDGFVGPDGGDYVWIDIPDGKGGMLHLFAGDDQFAPAIGADGKEIEGASDVILPGIESMGVSVSGHGDDKDAYMPLAEISAACRAAYYPDDPAPDAVMLMLVPKGLILDLPDGSSELSFPAADGGMIRARLDPGRILPAEDGTGRPDEDYANIRMDAGRDVPVLLQDASGKASRSSMDPAAIAEAWDAAVEASRAARGPKAFLHRVPRDMIRETQISDGRGGRMLQVAVPDAASAKLPGRETGYGSFLVESSRVFPSDHGSKELIERSPYEIFAGRENDLLIGYRIRSAEGKDAYVPADRKASEAVAAWEAWSAGQAEAEASKGIRKDDGGRDIAD